jgi:hypothetical protein
MSKIVEIDKKTQGIIGVTSTSKICNNFKISTKFMKIL